MSATYEITSLVGDVGMSEIRIENDSPTAKTYFVEQILPTNELSRTWVAFGPPGFYTATPSAGTGAISTLITLQPKQWVEIHENNIFKPLPAGDERQVTTEQVKITEKAPIASPGQPQAADGIPEIKCARFVQGDPDLLYPDININAEAIKNLFFCLRDDQKACLDWFENDGGGNLCTLIDAVVALQNAPAPALTPVQVAAAIAALPSGSAQVLSPTAPFTYIGADGKTHAVTIPVPVDKFLASAAFDPVTQILTLTLTDGTVAQVNLPDTITAVELCALLATFPVEADVAKIQLGSFLLINPDGTCSQVKVDTMFPPPVPVKWDHKVLAVGDTWTSPAGLVSWSFSNGPEGNTTVTINGNPEVYLPGMAAGESNDQVAPGYPAGYVSIAAAGATGIVSYRFI